MLQLKNIIKKYETGGIPLTALKGIDISFRDSEFVAILGQSGCGKTTLLNIIGGLDQYTEGDLIINGVSTKEFTDKNWDSYRNHSIGFVFQSYNLIPHQTVLSNVELALTLSGVSKTERRQRALDALKKVGLEDQIHKKPNQMSGGQMQRVAIARALVNNPDIVLADEPTGALDSETSLQIMDILKEIAKDKLVIMVTHNPDLASEYSNRIVKLLDGKIIGDTNPYNEEYHEINKQEDAFNAPLDDKKTLKTKKKKVSNKSMSFFTALSLSFNNLMTKKGRTILTAFAGSIGIIGIALILSVSSGMTTYINHVQETTLSKYPITLESTTIDLTSLMESMMSSGEDNQEHDKDAIYKNPLIADLVNSLAKIETNENDLQAFKTFLEKEVDKEGSDLNKAVSGIQYTYNMNFSIYTKNIDNDIIKSDLNELMQDMIADFFMQVSANGGGSQLGGGNNNDSNGSSSSSMSMMMMGRTKLWQELLPSLDSEKVINDVIYEQYELVNGSWPNEYDEVVLIVNEKNELDDLTLYALGLLSKDEIDQIIKAAASGNTIDETLKKWEYSELINRTYKTILPYEYYQDFDGDGIFTDMSNVEGIINTLYETALELKISGIIRPKEDADVQMLNTGIGYTSLLTSKIIERAKDSPVIQAQLQNKNINVLNGKPFEANTGTLTDDVKKTNFLQYVNGLNNQQKKDVYIAIKCLLTEDELTQKTMVEISKYPTRELQEGLVINSLSTQLEMDPSMLEGYLSQMTDEQIMGLAYTICQEIAKMTHKFTIQGMYQSMTADELALLLDTELQNASLQDFVRYYDNVTDFSDFSYEEVLTLLGYVEEGIPSSINIYVNSFENKDLVSSVIDKYNENVDDSKKIVYTDLMGLLMSGITTIINAITYVLIAFVAISLVVSSIMISVITLISVQERTKEIGILRAIGASKRDISRVFNAETITVGFASGLFGIGLTLLLLIPINLILHHLTGINNLSAILPVGGAIILVLISVLLTFIAGLIPAKMAARKDPVVALRSE